VYDLGLVSAEKPLPAQTRADDTDFSKLPEERVAIKDDEMGDKGGKKNKDKSKKQQSAKQEQKSKGKAERNRPKGS
jgi:hypothetical protein